MPAGIWGGIPISFLSGGAPPERAVEVASVPKEPPVLSLLPLLCQEMRWEGGTGDRSVLTPEAVKLGFFHTLMVRAVL